MLDRLKMTGNAMMTRMNQLEVITNNLANINTAGFKRDELFLNELDKKMKEIQFGKFEAKKDIPYSGSIIDFSQGALKGTGQIFDLAISGEGLFALESPVGEVYSRDGRFTVNPEGILTNLDGYPVMGEGGQIEIDLQENRVDQIVINDQGEIVIDGQMVDTIKLVTMDNPLNFEKIGSNLYKLTPGAPAPDAPENISVRQGYIEESNVNPVEEMVRMMEVFHFYQTGQKMIQAQDRVLNKAVNDIGRVV